MKDDYIRIVLNKRHELITRASFHVGENIYTNVDVKIDTGCPKTSVPVLKLGLSDAEAQSLKHADCDDPNIEKRISFGVNDSLRKRRIDRRRYKNKQYMRLKSISFQHDLKNFSLDGVQIGK